MKIQVPRWAKPLLAPARYKGAHGGRASGKSHFFAEQTLLALLLDKDAQIVCVREIQKSLTHSAKKLIESKIQQYNLSPLFHITKTQIEHKRGNGIIIFQGMQDHTADSIKSLEGFNVAWVEEAQSLSAYSMRLLLPTIRKTDSQLWFSWNPSFESDAVEKLFAQATNNMIACRSTYLDNPFVTDEIIQEAERHKANDIETYAHVWLGEYSNRTESQVFAGKYRVAEMQTTSNVLYGLDFGFAQDPLALVEVYLENDVLYIAKECGKPRIEIDETIGYIKQHIPNALNHVVRADSARPECISYLRRHGMTKVIGAKKKAGSVERGINFMRLLNEIVVHPSCVQTLRELQVYSYKVDRRTDDVLNTLIDKDNHFIDAIRYAIEPFTARQGTHGGQFSW